MSMILGITCAFGAIMLSDNKVRALFLTISTIYEITLKVHFTRNLIHPIQCISQILTTFCMCSGRTMVGL